MAVIYRHRRIDTNETFYIGIGKDLKRAYSKHNRNKWWFNIVEKCGYDVDIIFDNISWEEAKQGEILLIKLYGRKDLGTGILVNMTDGGDGIIGRPKFNHSEETKIKMSLAAKGRIISENQKEKIRNIRLGSKHSQETINKISFNSKNISDETRTKLSNAHKGKKLTEEHKTKMSKARVGKPLDKCKKLILNIETGIYYSGIEEAANTINITPKYLSKLLVGYRKNYTNFIYV